MSRKKNKKLDELFSILSLKPIKAKDADKLLEFAEIFYRNMVEINIKRESNDDIDWDKRRFDSLSRLIALDSQCAAVCFDGEEVLISFNEIHEGANDNKKNIKAYTDHVKMVMGYLKNCSLNDFNAGQEKELRMSILKKSASYYYKNNTALPHEEEIMAKAIVLLDDHNGEVPEEKIVFEKDIFLAAKRARRDLQKLKESVTEKHGIFANKKYFGDLQGGKKEEGKQFIKAINNGNFRIIKDGVADSKCHAEMRIIDNFLKRINQASKKIYIGLSKLCCRSCHLLIKQTSKGVKIADGPVIVETRGNHGNGFEWILIEAIKSNSKLLENFFGANTYAVYNGLDQEDKVLAISIVQKIGGLTKTQAKGIFGIVEEVVKVEINAGINVGAKTIGKGGVAGLSASEPEKDIQSKEENIKAKQFIAEKIKFITEHKDLQRALISATERIFKKVDAHKKKDESIIAETYLSEFNQSLFNLQIDNVVNKKFNVEQCGLIANSIIQILNKMNEMGMKQTVIHLTKCQK